MDEEIESFKVGEDSFWWRWKIEIPGYGLVDGQARTDVGARAAAKAALMSDPQRYD